MIRWDTPEDAKMLADAYAKEADRARQWAAIRRREAENEEVRAARLDARVAELRATSPTPSIPKERSHV